MPQILQLRVDDSTMEAIAELGKRQYPSSLPDRYGEALGYDRLAVLNDILSAGLAALTDGDAAVPPTPIAKRSSSKTATPPEDSVWIDRLEALETEVFRLGKLVASSSTTVAAVTPPPGTPPKATTPVATPVAPMIPIAVKAASSAEKLTRATSVTVKTPAKVVTKPVVQPIAKSAQPAIVVSPAPSSSVKKAKTPSRRRRSSSQMNPDEVKKLQDAPSLSKNGLASLCRCDKRTLDRKREDGELGQFTRARCGVEYAYQESDTRYYKVK